mgnify:CR=1 FL=1
MPDAPATNMNMIEAINDALSVAMDRDRDHARQGKMLMGAEQQALEARPAREQARRHR